MNTETKTIKASSFTHIRVVCRNCMALPRKWRTRFNEWLKDKVRCWLGCNKDWQRLLEKEETLECSIIEVNERCDELDSRMSDVSDEMSQAIDRRISDFIDMELGDAIRDSIHNGEVEIDVEGQIEEWMNRYFEINKSDIEDQVIEIIAESPDLNAMFRDEVRQFIKRSVTVQIVTD